MGLKLELYELINVTTIKVQKFTHDLIEILSSQKYALKNFFAMTAEVKTDMKLRIEKSFSANRFSPPRIRLPLSAAMQFYVGSRSMMQSSKKTARFIIILASVAFVLDVIDIFGHYYSPQSVAKVACALLPFARLSDFLLPAQLADFAFKQCQFEYGEPSTSIIFLMLKLVLVFLAISYFFLFWLPPIFQQTKKKFFLYIQEHGGILLALKDGGWPVLGLTMACIYFFLQINVQPNKYRTDIFVKLFENLACTILFFTLLGFLQATFFGILYIIVNNRKREGQRN